MICCQQPTVYLFHAYCNLLEKKGFMFCIFTTLFSLRKTVKQREIIIRCDIFLLGGAFHFGRKIVFSKSTCSSLKNISFLLRNIWFKVLFLNLNNIQVNNANFRDFYLPLVDRSFLALRINTNRGALVFPCEHCIIAKRFVFLFGPSGKELLLSAILHEQ